MRAPTTEERRRAAETLAAIAAIDSLQDGFVVFEAEGLAGGRWYEADEDVPGPRESVWASVPRPDADFELAIEMAIEARQGRLALLTCEGVYGGGGVASLADVMYETTAPAVS